MTNASQKYLDPEVLDRISSLELKARLIVEGYVSGLHRSPFHGFSVEFAEHREYVPGDDIRFLDWKVYGKTDRLYVKRFEEETNLEAHLVVDVSASMAYGNHREVKSKRTLGRSKFEYARRMAAALAYLITQQQDAAGLVLFDSAVRKKLPALNNPAHFAHIISELEKAEPAEDTGIARALAEAGEAIRRRGLVVLISDLMDDGKEVLRGLKRVRHRGHEVLLVHVLDQDEVNFPFERLSRFEGMEDDRRLTLDPVALRNAYLEEVRGFQKRLRKVCLANRIDLVEITTADSMSITLAAYLAKRAARARKRA